jgi:hypothetical protein
MKDYLEGADFKVVLSKLGLVLYLHTSPYIGSRYIGEEAEN